MRVLVDSVIRRVPATNAKARPGRELRQKACCHYLKAASAALSAGSESLTAQDGMTVKSPLPERRGTPEPIYCHPQRHRRSINHHRLQDVR